MRARAFSYGFLASFAVASALCADALAEPSASIAAPGRPIAAGDDASATAYNPANLAFLPGAELRWTWVRSGASSLSDGHAFDLALPLFDGFTTSLRLDLLDVERASGPSSSQQWLRWGLATGLGDAAAFGTTFGWSFSDRLDLNDQFSVTSALTARPCACLSLSAIARDWSNGGDRSYAFGLAARPFFGLRVAELGLEASVREQSGDVSSRATLGVDVPMVGRLRGELLLRDPGGRNDWTGLVGLDLNLGRLQAGGGAIVDGSGGDAGAYATVALRSFREPGLPSPKRVVRIRMESTPGVRKHTRLLTQLWRLAEDREVAGVLFEMRAEPASSLAHAEELGDAIRKLRAHGKKVMCHLEDAGGRALYACSQADRIAMNPAGGLRFAGLSSQYMYFGGVLEKLHVRSEFVRIAEHKLAAEQYTLKRSSEVGRADHAALLSAVESIYMRDVGGGRRMPVSKVREAIARGPFVASEAQREGLVDVLAYEDEIERFVKETVGQGARLVTDESKPADAPSVWGSRSRVAVIYLSGDMVDGESQTIPVLGIKLAGSYTVTKALKKAREDSSIKAVVFRIETGGGSSLAADVILREAQLVAKAKPMIVSMGTAAASGGYYASVSGAPIYANPGTITGSIGIFYGKVDVSGLLGQLGVGLEQFRTAPRADAESLYRPFSEEERTLLGVKVKQFYDLFIARVAEGRKMRPEEVDAVARGRVWLGSEALERKLVDRLAGLREAIEDARAKADLPADAPIVELPEEEDSLLGMLAKLAGVSASIPTAQMLGPIVIPPVFLELARGLSPFLIFDGTKPLARMELFGEASYGGLLGPVDDERP